MFDTDAFNGAADAIDFWVGQHSGDVRAEERNYTNQRLTAKASLLVDLNFYLPSTDIAENLSAGAAVREVLEHTVTEVHGLPVAERGHYLAQLLTRWFSDGHIDWLRFRVGHLLASYYAMMPSKAHGLGIIEVHSEYEELTVTAWDTPHGVYLDLVHLFCPHEDYLAPEVGAVLDAGHTMWPTEFAGVRYLPLDALANARHYAADGTWDPITERDFLDLAHPDHQDQQP